MDDDGVDADCFEQDDVFGKILGGGGVAHCVSAVLHNENLTRIALKIGQRLDQCLSLGEQTLVRVVAAHCCGAVASRRRP